LGENIHQKIQREDLGVNGRRILKWKLSKYGGSVSSEFRWLMIDTKGRDL